MYLLLDSQLCYFLFSQCVNVPFLLHTFSLGFQLTRGILYDFAATSGHGDYETLSMSVTFPTGSNDGTERCVSVNVHTDNAVESEEYFTVMLALVTTGTSFKIGNDTSTIVVMDSDGMLTLHHKLDPTFVPISAAALFEIPATATVVESDYLGTLCVTMATLPPQATLANEVILSLSSVETTGGWKTFG